MSDFLLWFALWLCDPLNKAEATSPLVMPTQQIAEDYRYYRNPPKPMGETQCHRLLYELTAADEMARRIANTKEPFP